MSSKKISQKPIGQYTYRKTRNHDRYLKKKLPWHRLPDETTAEYQYFVIYCELGVDRSVYKAYSVYKHSQGEEPGEYLPKKWRQCFKLFQWYERATQWDDYQTKQSFLQRDIQYKNQVKKYQQVLLEDAESFHKTGEKLLTITNQRIARIKQVERSLAKLQDDLSARELKAVINCYNLNELANTVARSVDIMAEANDQTGRALCVDKLLQKWSIAIAGAFRDENPEQIKDNADDNDNLIFDLQSEIIDSVNNNENQNVIDFNSPNNNVVINRNQNKDQNISTKLSIPQQSQQSLFDLIEDNLSDSDSDSDLVNYINENTIDTESNEVSENNQELGDSLDAVLVEY